MLKKLSTFVLAGMIAMPTVAAAGGTPADLEQQIDALSKQLQQLKSQMADMQAGAGEVDEDRAQAWDDAARFQLWGDFRTKLDVVNADTESAYSALNVGSGVSDFFQLNTDFNAAAATQGALSADGMVDFGNATLGDIMAAMGAGGVPTGTATANALTDLGAITSAMTTTQQNTFNTMMPMLDPTWTMNVLSGALNATLGDTSSIQPVAEFMKGFSAAQRTALFDALGYSPTAAGQYENDTLLTNRFRLNMRVKAMENIDFKGRLAMYKSWGMQNNPVDPVFGGPFMLSSLSMDGNSSRQPADNTLLVDRAYVNWNNINDMPIWFSIGRRPTSDGPPSQLRQGVDKRMATPTAYMDYPFDGLSLGYAYDDLFGSGMPGRIRFCYGRGYEAGPYEDDNKLMNDIDFAGLSWDVFKTENRFLTVQAFGAFNMFNVPDGVEFPNPVEFSLWLSGQQTYNPMVSSQNNILDRANLGNIYHTTGTYMAKVDNLNYFLSLGWSQTDPSGVDEMGTGLLTSWWDGDPKDKAGYSIYTGIRYDMPEQRLKLGLEYNWGSKDWIAFTPGHDDTYASKLAVRGHALEAYLIWDIPAGDAISRYAKAFTRLGYQYQIHEYTGGGFWLGSPVKLADLDDDPLNAQFYTPLERVHQLYLSLDVYF
jgi:outer membrane murein-binding lipoprotein Lpp